MRLVYLLHFDQEIGGKHHYIGFTNNLRNRLRQHREGLGAELTKIAVKKKIDFRLGGLWQGGEEIEIKMKKQKNSNRLCSICNGEEAVGSIIPPKAG